MKLKALHIYSLVIKPGKYVYTRKQPRQQLSIPMCPSDRQFPYIGVIYTP